jgi:hypothetical protein
MLSGLVNPCELFPAARIVFVAVLTPSDIWLDHLHCGTYPGTPPKILSVWPDMASRVYDSAVLLEVTE